MKTVKINVSKDYKKSVKHIFFELLFNEKYANRIIDAIDFGIKNDLVKINIFEVNYFGKKHTLTFHRNNWDFILNIIMKYYINIEHYEKCILIKKLIND